MLALIGLVIGIFIYARIIRNHKTYGQLILYAALAFILGSTVKSKIIQKNHPKTEMATYSNPTLQVDSTAFVWQENQKDTVMSKEENRDKVPYQIGKEKNTPIDADIEDDS